MFKLEREHKAGIVSGLIATIIFSYFLQPVLDWVSGIVVKILTITSTAFLDRLYAQAAHLQTQDYAFVFWGMVLIMFSVATFSAGIFRLVGVDSYKKLAHAVIPNRSTNYSTMAYRIISGILFLLLSAFGIIFLTANYVQLRTISSFQQHMKVIAPYISESEEKMIYSRWSLMKSHADYEAIYSVIRSTAKDHNVVLPENKIYTPYTI